MKLQIEYESKKVQRFFEDYDLLRKKIGVEFARSVKKRMDQLRAADTITNYFDTGLGNPHWLQGNLKECISISISGNYRLVVRPKVNCKGNDILELCNIIIVKGVEDYHGTKSNWLIP